jgi:hypothetical protein
VRERGFVVDVNSGRKAVLVEPVDQEVFESFG